MPGYKGLGLNTAIQSAQNLAWKLASVLRGQAGPELLMTYQTERHPVGQFAAHQSLTGPAAAALPPGAKSQLLSEQEELPLFYPIVGYRYRSTAVVSEDTCESKDELALVEGVELTGQPGTRVPHTWVERQGRRLSTLDLLDGRWILLSGAADGTWTQAAAMVTEQLGVELTAELVADSRDVIEVEVAFVFAPDVPVQADGQRRVVAAH